MGIDSVYFPIARIIYRSDWLYGTIVPQVDTSQIPASYSCSLKK